MKNFLLLIFVLPLCALAQTSHTVAPKESLYSIGRQYNIHPKELAAYNNISIETGLTIGQVIKIPAKATIPPVSATPASTVKPQQPVVNKPAEEKDAAMVPKFHKVAKKETLYSISKQYKNVSVDDLRKWNNLGGDGLSEGTNLIVGYQKASKTPTEEVVLVKEETPEKPVPVASPKQDPPKEDVVLVKKETQEKPVPVASPKQDPPKEDVTKETKPVAVVETKTIPAVNTSSPAKEPKTTGKSFNGGFFKLLYDEQAQKKSVVEETGTAGTFKSSSGWSDGKYYCLHNRAPAGTIVKITNKLTQKSVYAKVLDVIPDLTKNNGIAIRLSNAAADELGAGEGNFESLLNY